MPPSLPPPDWSKLRAEPDLELPLPGGLKMLFRRIPAGSFMMGSRDYRAGQEPQHRVVIPRDFYLGKFTVTQAEWRALVEAVPALAKKLKAKGRDQKCDPLNPSRFKGDRRPVENVSWDDATAWCRALTTEVAASLRTLVGAALQLRLPTEAEWEYACRAGTETDYHSGEGEAALAEVGWFGEDWERGHHPVGEKASNAAGLHDMHGNVWEWCRDAYRADAYRRRLDGEMAPVEDASADAKDDDGDRRPRVVRGGSWVYSPVLCRSAFRNWLHPGNRIWILGFRVCLAPGPAEPKTETEQAEAARGRGRRRPARPESRAADAARTGEGDINLETERITPPQAAEK